MKTRIRLQPGIQADMSDTGSVVALHVDFNDGANCVIVKAVCAATLTDEDVYVVAEDDSFVCSADEVGERIASLTGQASISPVCPMPGYDSIEIRYQGDLYRKEYGTRHPWIDEYGSVTSDRISATLTAIMRLDPATPKWVETLEDVRSYADRVGCPLFVVSSGKDENGEEYRFESILFSAEEVHRLGQADVYRIERENTVHPGATQIVHVHVGERTRRTVVKVVPFEEMEPAISPRLMRDEWRNEYARGYLQDGTPVRVSMAYRQDGVYVVGHSAAIYKKEEEE